jgi:hypothetical protein
VHCVLCIIFSHFQVPDEEALLEARLKAEAAKQKQEERLKDRTAAQGKAGSKTAAAAAPEAVAVELVGASESNRMPFTPITLVFKDLRWGPLGAAGRAACLWGRGQAGCWELHSGADSCSRGTARADQVQERAPASMAHHGRLVRVCVWRGGSGSMCAP